MGAKALPQLFRVLGDYNSVMKFGLNFGLIFKQMMLMIVYFFGNV